MVIPKNTFHDIVKNTPLISIDLIITTPNSFCLLGKRNNRPAKGFMFVPGGRIFKSEKIIAAFDRILISETGYKVKDHDKISFQGVYEHFYEDSYHDMKTSTHYVVLAYRLEVVKKFNVILDRQHEEFEWVSLEHLLSRTDVHDNVKSYFGENNSYTLF